MNYLRRQQLLFQIFVFDFQLSKINMTEKQHIVECRNVFLNPKGIIGCKRAFLQIASLTMLILAFLFSFWPRSCRKRRVASACVTTFILPGILLILVCGVQPSKRNSDEFSITSYTCPTIWQYKYLRSINRSSRINCFTSASNAEWTTILACFVFMVIHCSRLHAIKNILKFWNKTCFFFPS